MIKEFSIGFSRTVNLGNYESCRIESSVTVCVPPADGDTNFVPDVAVLAAEAQIELRKLLEDTFRAQHEMRKKTA